MEGEGELLDLSHLSEAEQSSILEVLLRDSELRSRDEGRLRALQQKEADPVRLRSLSGAWFNEERSKRHRDTKDGVDIVQASIRRRKPRTDLPLSGVFNGQTEDALPTNNKDPTSQINDKKEEDDKRSYRSQNSFTPTPRPRTRSPNTQVSHASVCVCVCVPPLFSLTLLHRTLPLLFCLINVFVCAFQSITAGAMYTERRQGRERCRTQRTQTRCPVV
uniref:RabBD domain-containing protein n=1 Tax=Hucho hucho TaxID=62062 RepID=A0A4W5NCG6_9TELE